MNGLLLFPTVSIEDTIAVAKTSDRQLIDVTVVRRVRPRAILVGVIARSTTDKWNRADVTFAVLQLMWSLVGRDGVEDAHACVPTPRALC